MIDNKGYRYNVGIIICNKKTQVLWARRFGKNAWQFPQGGIQYLESPIEAMYRELFEEIGLSKQDVKILTHTKKWTKYKIPKKLIRKDSNPTCIGQKQKWFLLKLITHEYNINILRSKNPEFDHWKWVNYWYPLKKVISFKRNVYKHVMKQFEPIVMSLNLK
ncbi:MAG: RNA pyrophosphohydrolase [Arsenophonus sp.]|nr:MAG: RNA pyrophosphohydrolase [Arsenophonus sp.]